MFPALSQTSRFPAKNAFLSSVVTPIACLLAIGAVARPAHAQRRLRLTVGATTNGQSWSGYGPGLFGDGNYTDSSIAVAAGIAYDFSTFPAKRPDNPALISAYFDHFGYVAGFFSPSNAPACDGLGVSVRKRQSSIYYGAGLGIYTENWHGTTRSASYSYYVVGGTPTQTNVGGKLFVGLEGRSSVFLEFAATGVASGQLTPGATILLGLRL